MASQSKRVTISLGSGGAVSLGDLRSSISTTRTTFTRIRTRRFNDRGIDGIAIQPDFITLVSLVCSIYREYEQDLNPIQQFHPDLERHEDGGHACVVSQRAISTITASNVKRGTTDALAEEIVVKRTRESVLTQNSAGLRSFLNEVRIRTHPPIRNHPNIVKFKGVAWDFEDDEASKPRPLLLEELAPQRSLETFWRQYDFVRMTFQSKVDLSVDIADGLAALHASRIVHGDVKPDNILVFPRIGHQNAFMAKLTDFGHSVSAHEDLKALPAFTPPWAAPEVLDNSDLTFEGMISTDVYSYGLVVLSIMIGRSYHRDLEDVDMLKRNDTMFDSAIALVEQEDRQNYDSDFDLDTLHLFLRHSLRRKANRRSLRRCIQIFSRYKASQIGFFAAEKPNNAAEQPHILGPLDASQLVCIGYRSLVLCSHQLRSRIVRELTTIAMNDGDSRQPAAAWELSICYFSGFGVPKDFSSCSRWLIFAAGHGIPAAKVFSKHIHEAMGIEPPILLESLSRNVEQTSFTGPQLDRIPEVLDLGHRAESGTDTRLRDDDRPANGLKPEADAGVMDDHESERCQVDEDTESDFSVVNDDQNFTVLPDNIIKAVTENDLTTLSALIAEDHNMLNARDLDGNTMLLTATRHGLFEVVKFLLRHDSVDASICNRSQESVLHHLSEFTDDQIRHLVPQLLARKADLLSEAMPTRVEDSILTFPARIRSCPILRSVLSGNLVLLKCLLEETHKTEETLPCRICEAGSRFRRIVAIALSTFRSQAIDIMLQHIKQFKKLDIDLSKIKVWSSRELVPLWKIPFQSLFITTVDLPDSFFRAISFGRHYMASLESTLSFLLDKVYHDSDQLYEMLREAVKIDNLDAVDFIMKEGQRRHLDPCWWLMTSKHAFCESPFITTINYGHRNIFGRLCLAYPAIFQDPVPIIDEGKLPEIARFFGERDMSYTRKQSVTMSQICLSLVITAPHQDVYFTYVSNQITETSTYRTDSDFILQEAKRKYIVQQPTEFDEVVARQSPCFLAQAILTSSFGVATTISRKYPETWRHSLRLQLSKKDDILPDTHLAIAFDHGSKFLEPISASLGYFSSDLYESADLAVPQYIFLLGSYDQCIFLLQHLYGSASQALESHRANDVNRSNSPLVKCEYGDPDCMYNRLTPSEFHSLIVGNIIRDRKDRQLLWKLIRAQVSIGQARSTVYLRLALRCGNNQAVNQLLDLGWQVNGLPWAPWANPWWFATYLQKQADGRQREPRKIYDSGQWKKPGWSALDTHQGLFEMYLQQQLKIYEEHNKIMKQNCRTLKERGGSMPWLVRIIRNGRNLSYFWTCYILTYTIVLPVIMSYVISPHWKCQTSLKARLGWSWLWSILAFINPPILLVGALATFDSFDGALALMLGITQSLLQHLVPLLFLCFVDCNRANLQGIQWLMPFSVILAEVAIAFAFAGVFLFGGLCFGIVVVCMTAVDIAVVLVSHSQGKGWPQGPFKMV